MQATTLVPQLPAPEAMPLSPSPALIIVLLLAVIALTSGGGGGLLQVPRRALDLFLLLGGALVFAFLASIKKKAAVAVSAW